MRGPVGRPRKRNRGVKNLFDFGCCLKKGGKRKSAGIKKTCSTVKKVASRGIKLPSILEEVSPLQITEAREIIECAESLGLTVMKDRKKTFQEVNNLLQKGNL